jgi:hypothetical protein
MLFWRGGRLGRKPGNLRTDGKVLLNAFLKVFESEALLNAFFAKKFPDHFFDDSSTISNGLGRSGWVQWQTKIMFCLTKKI